MNNKKCDIVKDLIPNYIENQISDTSRNFIDEHIKSCKDCADTLNLLNR